MRVRAALVCLLLGCSAGDLTLPDTPDPVTLKILSGNRQQADAGTLLDRPVVVQVLDDAGKPVTDASVEFDFLGEVPGAAVDPGVVTTSDDGTAEAFVRLGATTGTQMVLARVAGAPSPELSARFTVIALGSRGGDGGDDRGPGGGNGNGSGGDHGEDD
jgi:hypothetical protein